MKGGRIGFAIAQLFIFQSRPDIITAQQFPGYLGKIGPGGSVKSLRVIPGTHQGALEGLDGCNVDGLRAIEVYR